jgi:RES domain-containing protein
LSREDIRKELLEALVASNKPFANEYFREVELRWGHPDNVVSGEGTFLYGNRFVRPGKHAVYASFTEETALQEYKYGQAIYGRLLRPNVPHVTYPIRIEAQRCVDLRPYADDPQFAGLIAAALATNEHSASQVLGEQLIGRGIQAIIYPSAVPGHLGTNIVCILDTSPRPVVRVSNYDEVLALLKEISSGKE